MDDETDQGRVLPPERELRKRILAVSPVPIAILDSEGRVVLANERARTELGLTENELLGLSADHPDVELRNGDGEPLSAEAAVSKRVLKTGESVYNEVYQVVLPNDEMLWLSASGIPLHDGEGNLEAAVLAFENVTERKERERRFSAVFNNTYQFTGLMDPDGTLIEANETALEFGGLDREDVIGKKLWNTYWFQRDEATRERVRADVGRAADGEFVRYELDVQGADRVATIDFSIRPVLDDRGRVDLLIPEGRDITELKEHERELARKTEELERTVERLERTNAELEQFAYVASHDLQEPLRMISSYLDLLEHEYRDELDDEAREYIDYAVDGAERMREMIDDLLQFSRVQTREQKFEPQSLETTVEETLDNLALAIAESDATVTYDDLPTVPGDDHQLRQLFQNLLENAVHYAGEEPPRIHLTAEERDDAYAVAVEDHGVGIPPAEQDRIFDIFMRGASTGDETGSGIGLAICKRVVENHDGRIWVESEPGEGTTFHFTLSKSPGGGRGITP